MKTTLLQAITKEIYIVNDVQTWKIKFIARQTLALNLYIVNNSADIFWDMFE